jgi:hypothetical protein
LGKLPVSSARSSAGPSRSANSAASEIPKPSASFVSVAIEGEDGPALDSTNRLARDGRRFRELFLGQSPATAKLEDAPAELRAGHGDLAARV